MRSWRVLTGGWLLGGLAVLAAPSLAFARQNGIATPSCGGCHVGGSAPTVSLTSSNNTPAPGSTVRLTLSIQAVNGSTGGFYLLSSGPGSFTMVGGQPTRLADTTGDGVVHSALKSASGGQVVFLIDWNVPAAPGGVDLEVWAVSGNGADGSRGDGAGYAKLNLVYGCAGITYYRDFDGDGVGSTESGVHRDCAKPTGYADIAGDCNDSDERVKPGVPEVCNGRDDNCVNGADEGFTPKQYYPDADGDGYGGRTGAAVTGCAAPVGYGEGQSDCNDADPKIHPGATEVCNDRDDNCNNRVDEGVRTTCGVGLCIRASISCLSNVCTPGAPSREVCNALDDDCDGAIDNGPNLCPNGAACVSGICGGTAAPADGGTPEGLVDEPTGCQTAKGPVWGLLGLLALVALRRGRRASKK